MTTILTTGQVVNALISEGHAGDDAVAAIESFIDADTRDMDETGWAAEDVQVLRDQLGAQ